MANIKSYRPKIKLDNNNNLSDLKLDAETVKGVDVVKSKQDKLTSGSNISVNNINVAGNIISNSGTFHINNSYSEGTASLYLSGGDASLTVEGGNGIVISDDDGVTIVGGIKGNTFVNGTLNAKKMTLQYYDDASSTTKTGKWKGNLVPDADNVYDLGSKSKRWNEVYVNDLMANEIKLFDSNYNGYTTFVAETNTAPNEMVIYNFLTAKPIIKDDGTRFVLYDAYDTQFLEYGYSINDFKLKNGNTPFLKCDSADKGLIDIGSDTVSLVHRDKIQIIPKYAGDLDTLSIQDYDRIKIGGAEVVSVEDKTNTLITDIIFSYKRANSEGEIVPFAIAKDGKAFYQGYELITKNDSKALQTNITNIVNGTTVVAKATSATSATTATKAQNVNGYYPIQDITISGTTMTCTRTNNTKFSRSLLSGGSSTALYHHTVTMSNASGQFTLIISLLNSFIIPYSNATDIISYLFNAGFNSALTLKDTSGYYNLTASSGYNIKGVYCDTTENFKCICVRSTSNTKSEIMYAASDIVNVNDVVIPLIEP